MLFEFNVSAQFWQLWRNSSKKKYDILWECSCQFSYKISTEQQSVLSTEKITPFNVMPFDKLYSISKLVNWNGVKSFLFRHPGIE